MIILCCTSQKDQQVALKKELRKQVRMLKKECTAEELEQKSLAAVAKLEKHPLFMQAQRVMLYASLPDEVQTIQLIEKYRHTKQIILPTVVGDDIIPVAVDDDTDFAIGDFNIPEPQNKPYLGEYDLIVVPGMAFDKNGNRLGRGKGYYDRFLSSHQNVKRIGLCFDFQLVDSIPTEPTDIPVDEVIS